MKKSEANEVYTQQELLAAMSEFYSRDDFNDSFELALIDRQTLDFKPISDVEELLASVMQSISFMCENSPYYESDQELEDTLTSLTDDELLALRAGIWRIDGFRTHIIGGDIFAYKTEFAQDTEGTVFKEWTLRKYISNEGNSIMTITDYSYKGKLRLLKGNNVDEWLLYL